MVPLVHLLGEGIVGEAAFKGKYSWLHSVSCEDDFGMFQQFNSGMIKTIVAIPVKAFGVVQFGSRKKVLETRDFLDQAQSLLKEIDEIDVINDSENAVLSMDFTNDDLDGLLASFSSENSCDWNLNSANDENYKDLREVFSPCEERITSLEFEENSCFDSLLHQFLSETMAQEVHDSSLASLQNIAEVSFQEKIQNSMDNVVTEVDLPSSSSILNGISNSLEPVDMLEEFLKFGSVDDLCKWFDPSPDETTICKTMAQLEKTLSEPIEFNPICSDLGLVEKETSVVIHSSENIFLGNTEFDLGSDRGSELWGSLLTPMVNAAGTDNTSFSECVSEINTSTPTDSSRKRLFAELGIEELLRCEANYNNPFSSSNFENAISSNKKQMVEFSPTNRTQVHFANLTGSNLMHPVSDLEDSNSVLTKKDTFSKLQVGISVNDRNSINVKRAVPANAKRPEQPAKHAKKKAKPGESTRRPKDRQLIQDCIKELRGIIPHGGKCSIDSLLDRTIRYMLFLGSVVKYADKLQEPNEPKLLDQANGVIPKDKNHGATWAFEVSNPTMLCPIIVEDMNPPGQMLIEMLCEDQGFFLEIVDMIRGFGLNILKAKMDLRKNKLWARFIVEANKHVTRIDVFWSLLHLLQQPNSGGIDSSNKHNNVIDVNRSD
ncbi:transcription factor bHLH157-like [Vicia villosa]|uniref:transcription factor bHLH157-like n=1 Tax=Vicia villosa TaxID=3911 RepID=UPI00273CA035|nr:transcription factor bHLH157-like [Vicia villosa]